MPCYNNQRSCSNKAEPRMSRPERTMENTMPPCFPSLAVSRVVFQPFGSQTYDVCTAFMRGTIYPDLDKPFLGKGGCRQ
ncbi:MAG: spore coat associated protein CotJA [Butyrivibrio sp.]